MLESDQCYGERSIQGEWPGWGTGVQSGCILNWEFWKILTQYGTSRESPWGLSSPLSIPLSSPLSRLSRPLSGVWRKNSRQLQQQVQLCEGGCVLEVSRKAWSLLWLDGVSKEGSHRRWHGDIPVSGLCHHCYVFQASTWCDLRSLMSIPPPSLLLRWRALGSQRIWSKLYFLRILSRPMSFLSF